MSAIPELEITTKIGCVVNCIKYCPQEVITNNYYGHRILSFDRFKMLMTTVPPETPLLFGGFSEPFQNQETVDMIGWAHQRGHPIEILSTLVCLKPIDAIRLSRIPIRKFCLHLPDAEGNAKIPITKDYQETLTYILTHIKNLSFMNMGSDFISNDAEKIARRTAPVLRKRRVTCPWLRDVRYELMPNGMVYFCCMTRGVSGLVGSLEKNTFPFLVGQHQDISWRLQRDPGSICHKCQYAQSYHLDKFVRWKEGIFKNKTIMQAIFSIIGE